MRHTCLNMILELAELDERVVYIGSDLSTGTLDAMKLRFPQRFFMEGISEQSLIGIAAGIALEGFIPYVNTIASFLTRRGYEQIAIDVCLHDLPIRLIGNGGGLVYAPLGPTHQATDDIALLRALPNMTVLVPADAVEMRHLMRLSLDWPHPIYIRQAKGGEPIVSQNTSAYEIGRAVTLRDGNDVAIFATGVLVKKALNAAALLADLDIHCRVLNVHTVKPLDIEATCDTARHIPLIVTVEEHSRIGGLGAAVAETLASHYIGHWPTLRFIALPDSFQKQYGSQNELLRRNGLTTESIVGLIQQELGKAH